MTRRLPRLLAAAATLATSILAAPTTATACSCVPSGPPCQAYFDSGAVFVGTVQSITIRKRAVVDDRAFDHKYVRLAIDGPSRGVQGSSIEIWTGMGGGDCGFDFKEGQRYVVYAWRHPDGTLSAGICSRTRLYSEATEDIAYLNSGPAAAPAARVFGTIKVGERKEPDGEWVQHPVPDVQVNVRGRVGVYSGATDAEGRYSIGGVPPGAYEIEALPPPVFSTRSLPWKFEIKDARACRAQDFYLRYDGRISGTIVDSAGRPAAGVRIEIAPAGKPPDTLHAEPSRPETNTSGQFELSDVQPGRYVLGVGLTQGMDDQQAYPATWYPGTADAAKAREIEIAPGTRVQLEPWVVPDKLSRLELTGTVVWPDGTPVGDASVVLRVGSNQASELVRTDAAGAFRVRAFDRMTYKVQAYVNVPGPPFRQAQGEVTVRMSPDAAPVRIVVAFR